MKRVTRLDVAKKARVSEATVSLALKGHPRISAPTRELVETIAKDMNYRPLASASALAGGRTHWIGLVFSAPSSPMKQLLQVYSRAVETIDEELAERDYHLTLSVKPEVVRRDNQTSLPKMFREQGIEGVIFVQSPGDILADALERQGIPCVILDGISQSGHPSVTVDESKVAQLAVEHLAELGHTRIALGLRPAHDIIRNRDGTSPFPHRHEQYLNGYIHGMSNAGLPVFAGWDQRLPNKEHLEMLWGLDASPTAVLAYDSIDALRAMAWLKERGLSVPRDVSIVALHDTGYCDLNFIPGPTITSKKNMQPEMAQICVQKLCDMIEKKDESNEPIVLTPELIIRESTGPCIA